MELLILGLIGVLMGFFLNWMWAVGCIVIILIIILLLNYQELDGIGLMIIAIFAFYLIGGIILGIGLNYLSGYINIDSKKELPELICKIENQIFYIKEYEYKEGIITNLKTDQVFNKENCSLK